MTRSAFPLSLALGLVLAACGGSSASSPPPAQPAPVGPAATEKAPEASPAATASPGAAACDGGAASPGPAMTHADAEASALATMETMAALFEKNSADCKALAAGIRSWIAENCAVLLRMKAFAGTLSDAEKAELDRKLGDKATAIGARMTPGLQLCSKDADFVKVWQEIPQ